MATTTRATVLLLALSLVGACAAEGGGPALGVEDPEHDEALADGKLDAAGIREGTAQAGGILLLVNTRSREQLNENIGLSSRVADIIVAFREGDDGREGNDDDQRFETLTQLDSLPYVGASVFHTLLQYADAHDLLREPAESVFHRDRDQYSFIGGDRITIPALIALRPEPGRFIHIGDAEVHSRARRCTTERCSPWIEDRPFPVEIYLDREDQALQVRHNFLTLDPSPERWAGGLCKMEMPDRYTTFLCTSHPDAWVEHMYAPLWGAVTARGIYMEVDQNLPTPERGESWSELERKIVGTFTPARPAP